VEEKVISKKTTTHIRALGVLMGRKKLVLWGGEERWERTLLGGGRGKGGGFGSGRISICVVYCSYASRKNLVPDNKQRRETGV